MLGEIALSTVFGPVGLMLIGAALAGAFAARVWLHEPELHGIEQACPPDYARIGAGRSRRAARGSRR